MDDNDERLEQQQMMFHMEGTMTTLLDKTYIMMVVYIAQQLKAQGYRNIYF